MINAVAKHFDPDVYEEVKQLESGMREEVADKIADLLRRLKP